MDLSDDHGVVGAPQASDGAGAAYVFRTVNAWRQETRFAPAADGAYGYGLAAGLREGKVLVGFPYDAPNAAGSVRIYSPTLNGWRERVLESPAGSPQEFFGWSIAASETGMVVGAPISSRSGELYGGAAYVFGR